MSDSLQSHRMQHTGSSVLHYLLAFAQIHVHWVGEAIISSSSATPFSFCFQSFPSSGSFPMSQLFAFGSQDTGGSASASVLPMNIWGWFLLGLTGLIPLQPKGLCSPAPQFESISSSTQAFLWSKSYTSTWLLEIP